MADLAAARVLDWIDHHTDKMAGLLIRLVACETENPPERLLAECAGLLRLEMDRLGLRPEVIEPEPAGALDEPRIVARRAMARAWSTSMATSTSSPRRARRSSPPSGATARSPAGAPPT